MWTILNSTGASLPVNDIPIPQEIPAYGTASFYVADVLSSRTLATNIANGSLCVVSYGSFATAGTFLPVTYAVHPMATETQNGSSNPLTLGVFSGGLLLLNVSALTSGSSLEVQFSAYDGNIFYLPSTEIASVTEEGPVTSVFSTNAGSGRFSWVVTGSVTFSLVLQMQ